MSDSLIMFIGFAIGVTTSSIAYLIYAMKKFNDFEDEIQRLRTTRQILKEEIFRLEKNYKPTKPTPRKFRKKPKPMGKA